jgi:hypothetical protein
MTTPKPPVTPADPSRGICPTCGLYAKLPGAALAGEAAGRARG